jgi:hypothetical protein
VPCYGQVPQRRRAALPQVPALFHQRIPEAGIGDENRSRSRVGVTIMNCTGNPPSLFLQRVYSENAPRNCGRQPRSARCGTAFAESHHPLPPPLPTAGPFRTRHRPNMQRERGNFKVVSAAALNTSFRIATSSSPRHSPARFTPATAPRSNFDFEHLSAFQDGPERVQ